MRKIIENETGVYMLVSPIHVAALILLPPIVLLIGMMLGKQVPSLPLYIGLVAVMAIPPLLEFRKYGKLGKPMLAIQDGMLVIGLPHDSRGHLSFPLAELSEIIVYGPDSVRRYRLVRRDGTFVEAAPLWPRAVKEAAVNFFQRRVSSLVTVTVKEPQLLLSQIRGEGP